MTYLVLTAQRSAGKDTFSDYVTLTYGIPTVVFSEILREIGLEFGWAAEDDFIRDEKATKVSIANRLRNSEYGNELHTMRLVERVRGQDYILNGMRHPEELVILERELEDVHTVGIFADYKVREQRSISLGSARDVEHFAELEKKVTETPIPELLENSEYKIQNNGSPEEFYRNIDRLIKSLGFKRTNPSINTSFK
jgi:dephospho-CoA kinase